MWLKSQFNPVTIQQNQRFPNIPPGKWKGFPNGSVSDFIITAEGKLIQTHATCREAICWCNIIFSNSEPPPCIQPLSCPTIYIWNDCSRSQAGSYSINSIRPVSSISIFPSLCVSVSPQSIYFLTQLVHLSWICPHSSAHLTPLFSTPAVNTFL